MSHFIESEFDAQGIKAIVATTVLELFKAHASDQEITVDDLANNVTQAIGGKASGGSDEFIQAAIVTFSQRDSPSYATPSVPKRPFSDVDDQISTSNEPAKRMCLSPSLIENIQLSSDVQDLPGDSTVLARLLALLTRNRPRLWHVAWAKLRSQISASTGKHAFATRFQLAVEIRKAQKYHRDDILTLCKPLLWWARWGNQADEFKPSRVGAWKDGIRFAACRLIGIPIEEEMRNLNQLIPWRRLLKQRILSQDCRAWTDLGPALEALYGSRGGKPGFPIQFKCSLNLLEFVSYLRLFILRITTLDGQVLPVDFFFSPMLPKLGLVPRGPLVYHWNAEKVGHPFPFHEYVRESEDESEEEVLVEVKPTAEKAKNETAEQELVEEPAEEPSKEASEEPLSPQTEMQKSSTIFTHGQEVAYNSQPKDSGVDV